MNGAWYSSPYSGAKGTILGAQACPRWSLLWSQEHLALLGLSDSQLQAWLTVRSSLKNQVQCSSQSSRSFRVSCWENMGKMKPTPFKKK